MHVDTASRDDVDRTWSRRPLSGPASPFPRPAVRRAMPADADELLTRTAAVERVRALRTTTRESATTESVPLEAVDGRVLAEPVVASADSPPRDTATMDGFAVRAADDGPRRLRDGEVFPEDDPPDLPPGQAIRIATGAPLPDGADAVVKREDATRSGGRVQTPPVDAGTYVYRRGSNVAAGETLFEAGERLGPKDAILLRDLDVEPVTVRRRPSVGVLATGTEIHEGRQPDLDSPMLCGLVTAWGAAADFAGAVPDEADRVEEAITGLAADHDVVMTTGGTSVGHKDHVVRSLDALGEVLFHGVGVRPGKPIAVARLPDHDAVAFAIPGKPVGALTVATLVARPYFRGTDALPSTPATMSVDLAMGAAGFEYAVPVTIDDGTAVPMGHPASSLDIDDTTFDASIVSRSTRATRADGFVITETDLAAGETVRVVPYDVVQ